LFQLLAAQDLERLRPLPSGLPAAPRLLVEEWNGPEFVGHMMPAIMMAPTSSPTRRARTLSDLAVLCVALSPNGIVTMVL
jgi:hypothetical protein